MRRDKRLKANEANEVSESFSMTLAISNPIDSISS